MVQDMMDAVNDSQEESTPVAEETTPVEEEKGSRAPKGEVKKLRAECAQMKEQIKELTAQAEDMKDKYLRTLAEYDNYRKRTAKEREGIYADAYADCVTNLLPLLDNLGRASAFTDGDQVAEGVKMILGTLPDILGKMNVSAFGAPGETFNPEIHNAVMHVDDEQYGEGEIVEVFQQGYKYGDKIIRYAMVRVAN